MKPMQKMNYDEMFVSFSNKTFSKEDIIKSMASTWKVVINGKLSVRLNIEVFIMEGRGLRQFLIDMVKAYITRDVAVLWEVRCH